MAEVELTPQQIRLRQLERCEEIAERERRRAASASAAAAAGRPVLRVDGSGAVEVVVEAPESARAGIVEGAGAAPGG